MGLKCGARQRYSEKGLDIVKMGTSSEEEKLGAYGRHDSGMVRFITLWKLRLVGHIFRMNDSQIPECLCLTGILGGPKVGWLDVV